MAQILTGGWAWIENVENPKVQEVAIFAVREKNEQASWHLKYKSVVEGWTQVVNGINYKLIIEARHDGVLTKYEALVYEALVYESFHGDKRLNYLKPYKPTLL